MRAGVVAVLALAVGLGVGYLLGASKEAAAPGRATTQAGRELPPEIRPAGNTPLAQALRDLPVPQVERGDGTITGRVTRLDGTPVPSVTVRGVRSPERRDREGATSPDIEDEVRRLVADIHARRAGAVEALTGADGRYTLPGLAAAAYDLTASLAGYRIRAARGNRARAGATVDFSAEEALDIAFEVVLPDGTAAPDATIEIKSGNRSTSHAWSREDPRLLLPAGSFTCSAEHADGNYRSEEVPLVVADRAPPPPTVLLRLSARSGIRGTLFFASGLPFPDASVKALAFTGEKPPDPKRLSEGQGTSDWTTRDRGFRYQLLDLPPGRYLVGVGLTTTIVATRVVDVGERIETCDFVIDALDPSLYVVVRVLDPAGKPVTDATFELGYRADGGSSSSSGNEFPARPDGSYLILHQGHFQKEGGTYWVAAESARYGRKEVEYQRGETKEIVVRFGDAATVELTVAGFAGAEHSDALTAVLVPAVAEEDARFNGRFEGKPLDAQGRLTLGPVETGDYDLTLYAGTGHEWQRLHVATRRITLAAGKNPVTMPMPRLFTLTLTDPDRKAATLVLAVDGPEGTSIEAEADGTDRAVFAGLPEGRYQVARAGDLTGAMRVVLPGPSEVTFRPQPFSALRVVLDGAEGAWTKAGFLDGDLIVAVDGDELESAEELQAAQSGLIGRGKARLGVLRAGSRIELRIDAAELFKDDGGRLEWSIR